MKTCASCVYFDVSYSRCHGNPPTVALTPEPDGRMTVEHIRPWVNSSDRACRFHQAERTTTDATTAD